jgi:hypothetical protein
MGVVAHEGAQTSSFIKLLSILTKHTGAHCNQPVEPAKDWRSDCLEKRNLVGAELCRVLQRLHSIKGLAQSNNNVKLNYNAKHNQMLLETSAKKEKNQGGNARGRARRECAVSVGSRPGAWEATELGRSLSLFGWTCPLFFFFCPLFLFGLSFFIGQPRREGDREGAIGRKPWRGPSHDALRWEPVPVLFFTFFVSTFLSFFIAFPFY